MAHCTWMYCQHNKVRPVMFLLAALTLPRLPPSPPPPPPLPRSRLHRPPRRPRHRDQSAPPPCPPRLLPPASSMSRSRSSPPRPAPATPFSCRPPASLVRHGRAAGAVLGWRSPRPWPFRAFGKPLASISTGPGYECRPRNRMAGAKISSHGQGDAADVLMMELAGGQEDHRRKAGRRGCGEISGRRARVGLRGVQHGAWAGVRRVPCEPYSPRH